MNEVEFSKRLTLAERDRLDRCADEIGKCSNNGAYSFMAYWAERIEQALKLGRERMAREDAEK